MYKNFFLLANQINKSAMYSENLFCQSAYKTPPFICVNPAIYEGYKLGLCFHENPVFLNYQSILFSWSSDFLRRSGFIPEDGDSTFLRNFLYTTRRPQSELAPQ
jgi:hypothetical protein